MNNTVRINVWQARALARFIDVHDDRRTPDDDTLDTAYATLVRLSEDGVPDPNGYVLGVLTDDGDWCAFWGDGEDVTAEYQRPRALIPCVGDAA